MSKEAKDALKAASRVFYNRCLAEGIRFPRTRSEEEHLRECGTVRLAHRKEDGSMDEDAALQKLKDKYGLEKEHQAKAGEEVEDLTLGDEEEAQPKAKKTKARHKPEANDDEDEAEAKQKKSSKGGKRKKEGAEADNKPKKSKAKKTAECVCEENTELAMQFTLLSKEGFKVNDKGSAFGNARIAKTLREFPAPITKAEQVRGIKGIGDATIEKIDEFLTKGFITALEEKKAQG